VKINDVQFALAAPTWNALPPGIRPEIAFAGRSNVGKSSLLNALLGRKNIARTSGTPGKTQALNFYAINPNPQGDPQLYLVDLPGFGYAKVARSQREAWQLLIGRYLTERAEAGPLRAVVQLIDSRHDPTALDLELIAVMRESSALHLIALTKSDKLTSNGRAKAVAGLKRILAPYGLDVPIVLTSSEKKEGMADLWHWIDSVTR
jgi:GTP-binding protein